MRIWFVQAWPRWEIALELAQTHLDAGDEVEFLGCDKEMTGCWLDYKHRSSVCSKCVAVRSQALSLLSSRVRFRSFIKLQPLHIDELRTMSSEFADISDLLAFHMEDFDIGAAVASGLMTTVRDSRPDIHQNIEAISRSLVSSWAMYRSIQNHLDECRPDCVYVANARGAEARSVLRACQSRNVLCRVHESGHDQDHYEIFPDTFPHDILLNEARLIKGWESADPAERERVAVDWFLRRAAGSGSSPFVVDQHAGCMPASFDSGRRNIVVFNSSEEEFAALDSAWQSPIYRDQAEGLHLLRESISRVSNPPNIYLRMHPSLRGVDNLDVKFVLALNRTGFEVIPPESSVSTYELMRRCDTVLTYGSTTGIEAVFWGKPSILAGVHWYRNLGGTYNPNTHEELMKLLLHPLEPKDKIAALKYGYYMATFGTPFRYYRAKKPMSTHFEVSGKFNGTQLAPGAMLNYFWAAVHRLPWLQKLLDARNLRQSERKLGLR